MKKGRLRGRCEIDKAGPRRHRKRSDLSPLKEIGRRNTATCTMRRITLPHVRDALGLFPQKVLITIYVRRVYGPALPVLASARLLLFGAHARTLSLVAFCGNNLRDP